MAVVFLRRRVGRQKIPDFRLRDSRESFDPSGSQLRGFLSVA